MDKGDICCITKDYLEYGPEKNIRDIDFNKAFNRIKKQYPEVKKSDKEMFKSEFEYVLGYFF